MILKILYHIIVPDYFIIIYLKDPNGHIFPFFSMAQLKRGVESWWDGLFSNVLVSQTRGPELDAQTPGKQSSVVF